LQPAAEEGSTAAVGTGRIEVTDACVLHSAWAAGVGLHHRYVSRTTQIIAVAEIDVAGPAQCRHAEAEAAKPSPSSSRAGSAARGLLFAWAFRPMFRMSV
jgi:hypothetical protein